MRIMIICGAGYVSGKEKIMLSMLKGFRDAGDDVFCLTSSWGNGQYEKLMIDEKIPFKKIRLGFITKTLDLKAMRMTLEQLIYWPGMLLAYRKAVKRFNPDAVIHTNFHHLFLLYPVVSSKKITHIYHSHESVYNTSFYRRLFNLFNRKVKLFVSVSAFVSWRIRNLGINHEKTITINNGLELLNDIDPHQSPPIFTVGIAGQVGAWKGHEDLLDAFKILRDKYPGKPMQLFIFGTGKPEFTNLLEKKIADSGLRELVYWKGFVNDVKDIYAGLSVLCVPTRTEEPFATSALEAAQFGVPVVVTNKGGFPEIVQDAVNGYIVESHNPAALAEKLSLLLNDPEMVLAMGERHRQYVTGKFSYKGFIDTWRKTISSLIS